MSTSSYKMQKYEAICLIIIIMVNKLILNVPFYIASSIGSGAVVNIIYIGIIDLILVLLINKLLEKFQNSDIIDISEFLAGKIFKVFVGIIFICFFFISSFITLSDFSNMLQTIYFPGSSIIYILLFFILAALISNLVGFKSISRTICLVVPFLLLSILVSFIGSFEEFSLENFKPILGYSFKNTFVYGLINVFSVYAISYYFFLSTMIEDPISFKKITITSYVISWLLLFITIISILTLFPIANGTEPISTLYLLSRKIEIGNYIQRVDTFFILIWIMSIFSYLSITIFMVNRIIKKLTLIVDEKMLSFSTCSILFGLCLLPVNSAHISFLEKDLYKYMVIGVSFCFCILILIFANAKFKIKKGKVK